MRSWWISVYQVEGLVVVGVASVLRLSSQDLGNMRGWRSGGRCSGGRQLDVVVVSEGVGVSFEDSGMSKIIMYVRVSPPIATSKGSQMLILMNMAERGGAIRVVMCGIDDRKDRYLVLFNVSVT